MITIIFIVGLTAIVGFPAIKKIERDRFIRHSLLITAVRVIRQDSMDHGRLGVTIKNNGVMTADLIISVECLDSENKTVSINDQSVTNAPLIDAYGFSVGPFKNTTYDPNWAFKPGDEQEFRVNIPPSAIPETCKPSIKSWVDFYSQFS